MTGIHLFLLVFFNWKERGKRESLRPRALPLRVQTIQLKPSSSREKEPERRALPASISSSAQFPSSAQPAQPVPNSEKGSKDPPSSSELSPNIDLLQKVQQNLENAIEQMNRIDLSSSLLQVDLSSSSLSSTYEMKLQGFLQSTLHFPEKGRVRIELSLAKDGQVIDGKILFSDSDINRKYVENFFTHVLFPPFEGELAGEESHAFSITFIA